jgi:hypothetical protein
MRLAKGHASVATSATKMRSLNIALVSVVGIAAVLYGCFWLMMGPLHTLEGRQNTRYSARFTPARFDQLGLGRPRAAVTSLLGQPFHITVRTNYPGWALREPTMRQRYGTNNLIRFEVMSFSEPKKVMHDYELVDVAIGPDCFVVAKERFVTD